MAHQATTDYHTLTLRRLMWKSSSAVGTVLLAAAAVGGAKHHGSDLWRKLTGLIPNPTLKAMALAAIAVLGMGLTTSAEIEHFLHVVADLQTEEFWIGATGLALAIAAACYVGFFGWLLYTGVLLGDLAIIGLLTLYGFLRVAGDKTIAWFEDWRLKQIAG